MCLIHFTNVLIVSFLVSPSVSWELPSKEFLERFAHTFDIEGVSIYLPNRINEKKQVLSAIKHLRWVKTFRSNMLMYIRSKVIYGLGLVSARRFYISVVDEIKVNVSGNPNALHVMAATSHNTDSSYVTRNYLSQNFENREAHDTDVWLYGLDISVQDTEEIKIM